MEGKWQYAASEKKEARDELTKVETSRSDLTKWAAERSEEIKNFDIYFRNVITLITISSYG